MNFIKTIPEFFRKKNHAYATIPMELDVEVGECLPFYNTNARNLKINGCIFGIQPDKTYRVMAGFAASGFNGSATFQLVNYSGIRINNSCDGMLIRINKISTGLLFYEGALPDHSKIILSDAGNRNKSCVDKITMLSEGCFFSIEEID